jgi:hypothetical protein
MGPIGGIFFIPRHLISRVQGSLSKTTQGRIWTRTLRKDRIVQSVYTAEKFSNRDKSYGKISSYNNAFMQKESSTGAVKHWKWCTWHRKSSAENSSKLNKFLHCKVNLLIHDQDGQNNNKKERTQSYIWSVGPIMRVMIQINKQPLWYFSINLRLFDFLTTSHLLQFECYDVFRCLIFASSSGFLVGFAEYVANITCSSVWKYIGTYQNVVHFHSIRLVLNFPATSDSY